MTKMITKMLESNVLCTGGSQNELNGSKILPIDVIKVFHHHDVNDDKKVDIKCFWAQDIKIFH